jgi:Fur family zinc uptake transcriptional regulator
VTGGEVRTSARPGRPRRGETHAPLHEVARSILAESGRPLTAYALLAKLEERLGRHLSPPSVYRALGQLSELGVIARIESRNAFLSVNPAAARSTRMFLLCGACGTATEIDDPMIERRLVRLASARDFAMARGVVELEGLCGDCGVAEAGSGWS